MQISIKEVEWETTMLPLHEEIATFEGGRVISTLPSRSIAFIFDDGKKYNFSINVLGESLEEFRNKENKNTLMDYEKEVFEYALSRDLNISITWQKITNWSIEIYRGYESKYEKIYYTDGHIDRETACLVAYQNFCEGSAS